MDLSDYAVIFILVMMVGVALLMLAAYKMEKHPMIIFFVALIGLCIGLWIRDLCDFKDASLETVVTMILSALLPASIIVCIWVYKYVIEMRDRKIQLLKHIIIEEFEIRRKELCVEKELLEKELLLSSSMHNLLQLIQLCVSEKLNFYENHVMCIDRKRRSELLNNKKDKEEEISIIDDRIEDLRINKSYTQLLRIKRGDMK